MTPFLVKVDERPDVDDGKEIFNSSKVSTVSWGTFWSEIRRNNQNFRLTLRGIRIAQSSRLGLFCSASKSVSSRMSVTVWYLCEIKAL